MKTTVNGYRLNRNGKAILGVEKEAIVKETFVGESLKSFGTYYFFNRKQGDSFIYLP